MGRAVAATREELCMQRIRSGCSRQHIAVGGRDAARRTVWVNVFLMLGDSDLDVVKEMS